MVIPGSHADLRAVCGNGDQAPFWPWVQRNRELIAKVACGAVECCGEWQRPGYHGWCSLLTRPVEATLEDSICPRARQAREESENAVRLLEELELICEGEIDVWNGD